jgi:hypothetical protein
MICGDGGAAGWFEETAMASLADRWILSMQAKMHHATSVTAAVGGVSPIRQLSAALQQ